MKPVIFFFCLLLQIDVFGQIQMPVPSVDISEFLSKNLRYPKSARNRGIEGQVIARFVINEEGYIDSVDAITNIGYGLEQEAIRVVSAFPRWTPGYLDGKPVRIFYTLPIRFRLEGSKYGRQRANQSMRDAMEEIKRSQYLLQGLKANDNDKHTIRLSADCSFYQPKQKDSTFYFAGADSGVYRLIMSSDHGNFFMSDDAFFFFNGDEAGGLFQPFDRPDKLLLWHCKFRSREKAFKKFSNEGFVKAIPASPTVARLFICEDYIITNDKFEETLFY